MSESSSRARQLRRDQTRAEGLLWRVLKAKRLSGLKFRRQHPIGPFFADFACPGRKWVVEIDGGYHELKYEEDRSREEYLEAEGWRVLRFSNEDVLEDVEAVAIAIARQLGVPVTFGGGTTDGVTADHAARNPSP